MNDIVYRLASANDVNDLARLRAAFLTEVEGTATTPELFAALTDYFLRAVPAGEFVASLAVAGHQIVATSGMTYRRCPPSSRNLQGLEAYVMNMYTVPGWRNRGIATALLHQLIAIARNNNCSRVTLHALPLAAPVYARLDFQCADGEMRLDLP